MPDQNHIVYSTDTAGAKQPGRESPPVQSLPPQQQTARIQREKKGRGGKTVTVISGLQLAPADLTALTKRLKAACGTGGTVKDGNIEIQGDLRDRVAAELKRLGYKLKFVGG